MTAGRGSGVSRCAVVLLLTVAACSSGTRAAPVTPTSSPSATPSLSAVDAGLVPKLLTAKDFPAGWTAADVDSSDGESPSPLVCGTQPPASTHTGRVALEFDNGQTESMDEELEAYPDEAAATAWTSAETTYLAGCTGLSAAGTTFTVKPLGAAGLEASGTVSGRKVVIDLVVGRTGATVTILQHTGSVPLDSGLTTSVLAAAVAKT